MTLEDITSDPEVVRASERALKAREYLLAACEANGYERTEVTHLAFEYHKAYHARNRAIAQCIDKGRINQVLA